MWNRMKNWLQQMRREHTSSEDEQPPFPQEDETNYQKQRQEHQPFQTKMVYQYPKQGNFRFPMIPDENHKEHRQKPKREESAWQQERASRGGRSSRPSYTSENYEKGTEDKKWSHQSTYQQNSYDQGSPFTPSSVPSPIYGYGKREGHFSEISLDELPSFMKKTDEDDRLYESTLAKVLPKTHPSTSLSDEEMDEEEHNEDPVSHFETVEEQEGASKIVDLFQEDETDEVLDKETVEGSNENEVPPTIVMFGDQDAQELEDTEEETEQQQSSLDEQSQEPATLHEEDEEQMIQSQHLSFDEMESEMIVEERNHDEEPSDVSNEETDVEDANHIGYETTRETAASVAVEDDVLEEEQEDIQETKAQQDRAPSENLEGSTEGEVGYDLNEQEADDQLSEKEDLSPQDASDPQPSQEQEKRDEVRSKRPSRPFNVIMTPRDKRYRDTQKANASAPKAKAESVGETKETETEQTETVSYNPVESTIPPYHLLNDPPQRVENEDEWIEEQMELLETTLHNFHVKAKVVNAMKGPAVTRFEVQPEPGVKVSKITNLTDDIKMSLAAKDIRMEAPIPGKNAIGIEVPNQKSEAVGLQEILESDAFTKEASPLSVGLGLDIEGSPIVTDLKKMPHGLIAGATGSGKSVCINTILVSLLYKANHDDVKFLLIDPKMVELAPYNELPHLVAPVITDVKAATSALKWAVKEMEQRYERFVEEGVRDIDRYNDKMKAQGRLEKKMPYLVIVIDELADLMMMSPQDVEDAICRIAQKARACGMHLLLATQRPSVDVITGLIKANIPTRVAFSVSSQVDSRTIVDTSGAEKLLGKGDMLFLENGAGKTKRIQGAFVSDDEIERITNYVKKIASPNYLFEQEELMQQPNFEEEEDDLFEEAVGFVIDQNGASASLLQRRFKVGYNRAARLIDTMEEKGIISESKGSKPRDVFVDHAGFQELRKEHE